MSSDPVRAQEAPTANIAAVLPRIAAERPDQPAMRCPGGKSTEGFARYDVVLTYGELDRRSDAMAAGLEAYGIRVASWTALSGFTSNMSSSVSSGSTTRSSGSGFSGGGGDKA